MFSSFRKSRSLILGRTVIALLVGLVMAGPLIVGVTGFRTTSRTLLLALFILVLYGLGSRRKNLNRLALVILSVTFAVTVSDLLGRPTLAWLRRASPQNLPVDPWPQMPLVTRYEPVTAYSASVRGDLVAMTGLRDWPEHRDFTFETDERGFISEGLPAQAIDLIVLGDSFGTTMETTGEGNLDLSAIIARDHNLKVQNLSIPATGPWQEYFDLATEIGRLRTYQKTVVLWLIFGGNDLDEQYPTMDFSKLPWQGRSGQYLERWRNFQRRSPIRQLLDRLRQPSQGLDVTTRWLDGRPILFYKPYVERSHRSLQDILNHPNYAHLKEVFAGMKNLANEKHLSIKVVAIPGKEEVYSWILDGSRQEGPSPFAEVIGELSRQENFDFLDLRPELTSEAHRVYEESGQMLWWRGDTHWNALGQKCAAEIIFRHMQR